MGVSKSQIPLCFVNASKLYLQIKNPSIHLQFSVFSCLRISANILNANSGVIRLLMNTVLPLWLLISTGWTDPAGVTTSTN